jgi:hypothetical protein
MAQISRNCIFLIVLFFSSSLANGGQTFAPARSVYQIHELSEHDVLQTYTRLLRDACHYADRDWNTASFDPAIGYWGDGVSRGNQGIRTIASMVLA